MFVGLLLGINGPALGKECTGLKGRKRMLSSLYVVWVQMSYISHDSDRTNSCSVQIVGHIHDIIDYDCTRSRTNAFREIIVVKI